MIFKQDFKKLYVRAAFIFGWWISTLLYIIFFLRSSFDSKEVIFVSFIVLFPLLWCLSYYWYYFKIVDDVLIKNIFGRVKSIPIKDITELSYEANPARPLVYITFNKSNGGEDYIEFTTGVWSPNTLYSLNQELQRKNPNIQVKFDEKTRKNFEKDKDYHLHHPNNIFGWVGLGLKQIIWGLLLAVILVAIQRYL